MANTKVLYRVKDMLIRELEEISELDELNTATLDVIYKASKAAESICRLIDDSEGGESYGDWAARGSYSGGSSMRGDSGSSMRGDSGRRGSSYDGGTSGRRHHVRGHMSYDDGVEEETRKYLEDKMSEARDEETRNAFRMILDTL